MALFGNAGQSNAGGAYLTTADLPPHLQNWSDDNAFILVGDHLEVINPGVNVGLPNQPGSWSYLLEITHEYRKDHPDEKIVWVQEVKGTTGLDEDPNQLDWSFRSHDELFDRFVAKLNITKGILAEAGEPTDMKALYWMQGEQDAADLVKAGAYEINLTDEFGAFRDAAGQADLKIIFGQIATDANLVGDDIVRQAQANVDAADPFAVSFDTDDLTMQADHLHYDGLGQSELGQGMYAALKSFDTPEPVSQVADYVIDLPDFHAFGGYWIFSL